MSNNLIYYNYSYGSDWTKLGISFKWKEESDLFFTNKEAFSHVKEKKKEDVKKIIKQMGLTDDSEVIDFFRLWF